MQETIDQLKHLFRNFWDNRWQALIATVLLAVIGWMAVIVAPDRYEVTARVYVDTRSMLKPLLKGIAVDSTVTESTAEIMKRTLLSRPNLELIARRTGLDATIESPESYDKMIKKLSEVVLISGGKEVNNIYTLSYTHQDPVMAKNVTQALVDVFIEKVIGANRLDTDEAKKYLDKKIEEYEAKLVEAENKLKNFKKEHPGVLVTNDDTYFARLESMKNQLQTAQLNLQEQKHRRSALSKQLKSTPSYTSSGGVTRRTSGGVVQNPIDLSIIKAQGHLESLLGKFTSAHPDVMAAKRALQQLESQRNAGATGAVASTGESTFVSAPVSIANPAYQTLKLAYGEADAMVAALTTRVAEYEKRLAEQEANVDTLPDIEAKLANLNRDYRVNKNEYEELLKRRESAEISEGANNVDELQLKVIDPPRVPLVAAGPNRLKWLTMVFLMALGIGVGGSIFFSMIRPKIYDKQSVKQITTLPILGNVSHLTSVGEHFAKGAGNITYSLASGVLLLVYAALMLAYMFNVGELQDYAGLGAGKVEERIGTDVINPIKDALEKI